MRRGIAVVASVVLLSAGCGADGSSARRVRVDFRHDEFASHYWRYFPRTVYAHPGDELVFDQEWTGEPHTVTFGTNVDEAVPRIEALEAKYAEREPETEAELAAATKEYEEATARLPVFDPYLDLAEQAAVLPCYLDDGTPGRGDAPCPQREQPDFDGKQAYYSSGFISPVGAQDNVFRVPLSSDIEPGTYRYYCIIHFPDMQGRLVVRNADDELPSQSEIAAKARSEIEELARPLREAFADARAGNAKDPNGESIDPPIAGYHSGEEYTVAVDEFVPKTWTARVDDPVTWTITGAHTISFGVPRYVPIYRERDDGTIERNPVIDRAAGGSPKAPPVDFTKGPVEIDGGTWDGTGFISSGLLGAEPVSRYTLRVSKPGRYRYACLVHPTMVGTLVVER